MTEKKKPEVDLSVLKTGKKFSTQVKKVGDLLKKNGEGIPIKPKTMKIIKRILR